MVCASSPAGLFTPIHAHPIIAASFASVGHTLDTQQQHDPSSGPVNSMVKVKKRHHHPHSHPQHEHRHKHKQQHHNNKHHDNQQEQEEQEEQQEHEEQKQGQKQEQEHDHDENVIPNTETLDQQEEDFIDMASRVSGKSPQSIENMLIAQRHKARQKKRQKEQQRQQQRQRQAHHIHKGEGQGLLSLESIVHHDQDGGGDSMHKMTTLKVLLRPNYSPEDGDSRHHLTHGLTINNNDMRSNTEQEEQPQHQQDEVVEGDMDFDGRLILKHSESTRASTHGHHHQHDNQQQHENQHRSKHKHKHHKDPSLHKDVYHQQQQQQQQHTLKLPIQKQRLECLQKYSCSFETTSPFKEAPAIFYVPHQDDDALAMALAIREHIEAGRKVIVHLYSDGINAQLREIVAGVVTPCPLEHEPHQFSNLTLKDVVTGRTHEFRQSLRKLGIEDENIFETGWSDIEPVKDYQTFRNKLKDLILGYETKYPGASHKCISGMYDRDGLGRNPTHLACWDVARELIDDNPGGHPNSTEPWDFRFYRTYTYYKTHEQREAQFIRALPQYLKYKQRALDQYKKWKPSHGELAWGYHSVKILIDASYNDPYVYMDMLDNDPTNPASPNYSISISSGSTAKQGGSIMAQSAEEKKQLLDKLLPPKDMAAIWAEEDKEREQAKDILSKFEQAMRGPEGLGYKAP
ncbi:hypothetical protein BG004_005282 [Podila humilis]|nr:hypothetical protein BG004_005282 [Podila humilis]